MSYQIKGVKLLLEDEEGDEIELGYSAFRPAVMDITPDSDLLKIGDTHFVIVVGSISLPTSGEAGDE
jgi:hypothetical protein